VRKALGDRVDIVLFDVPTISHFANFGGVTVDLEQISISQTYLQKIGSILNVSVPLHPQTQAFWNGQEIVFQRKHNLLNTLYLMWRYGISEARLDAYLRVYEVHRDELMSERDSGWKSFLHLTKVISSSNISCFESRKHFLNAGCSPLFIDEIIEGIVRSRFLQGLESMPVYAAISAIKQISNEFAIPNMATLINKMLERAKATIVSNIAVTSVCQSFEEIMSYEEPFGYPFEPLDISFSEGGYVSSKYHLETNSTHLNKLDFDAVIVATRIDHTIAKKFFADDVRAPFSHLKYKDIFVTLTHGHFNHSHFGFKDTSELPDSIFTVSPKASQRKEDWTSLTILKKYPDNSCLIRIDSEMQLSDKVLSALFIKILLSKGYNIEKAVPDYTVWKNELSSLDQKDASETDLYQLDHFMFYLGALEGLLGPCLECSLRSTSNAVDMILNQWKRLDSLTSHVLFPVATRD